MENTALKLTAFLLITLLVVSIIPLNVSAEAGVSGEVLKLHRLRVQAEFLQRITSRIAEVATMTTELKLRVREILEANISIMSIGELSNFVREAKAILAELRGNLDSGKLMGEENVTRVLAERLRERLKCAFTGLNITKEECYEFREQLRHAWSFGRLKRILGDIRTRMAPLESNNITDSILESANKSAEWGNMTGLERALNSSLKVLEVLERIKEKLMFLNASPAAIAAIEHAIEKISMMRELLALVKERVEELKENHSLTRQEIREMVKNRTRMCLQGMEERLSEYIEELESLREAALEKNLTSLADELDSTLNKLKGLLDEIKKGNFSLKQAIMILVEAERALRKAEKVLEKASEREELREILMERLRERIRLLERKRDQLRERLEKLRGSLPENMLCRLEEIENMLQEALNKLQEAERGLSRGESSRALGTLDDVEKDLKRIDDGISGLEPHAKGRSGPSKSPLNRFKR